jgi:universal stress protein E
MDKPNSILVVTGRNAADAALLSKALRLARQLAAGVELFLCDAEHAYALQHAYERSGVESVKKACIVEATEYLTRIKAAAHCEDVCISVDAACESPLYEGIVYKVRKSGPLLVIKQAGGMDERGRAVFDANDWQLMRACPATLLLTRGKRWKPRPRFGAAVDVSEQEVEGLGRLILQDAGALARLNDAELDLLYAECESVSCAASQARAIALESLARESHVPTGHVHILAGEPERALPTFSRGCDYDVLVLGALTHRQGLTPLVGTLTSKLVDALDCDFILVKRDGAPLTGRSGQPLFSAHRA